ncbi:hypothetical protein LCGC14_1853990 [marine sediment metagenome]|uniref:Uncharacterized protein n=1 Tax=marine sediment metagenome TaxID=412755 RepID=A0A0F9G9Y4_9ZZZZ
MSKLKNNDIVKFFFTEMYNYIKHYEKDFNTKISYGVPPGRTRTPPEREGNLAFARNPILMIRVVTEWHEGLICFKVLTKYKD